LLFAAFSIFYDTEFVSQEHLLKPTRPKIGLVLSGGGAKGFAHIGVLKVLEQPALRSIILAEPVWALLWAVCMLRVIMHVKSILSLSYRFRRVVE
jgi:hypothetical protein